MSLRNSTTTTTTRTAAAAAATTTTSSHNGVRNSTQAVYFTVSFTLVGIVAAAFCSAIYIWRRKRRMGIADFSCYRDKNTVDDRTTNRMESVHASGEMFPCSTLDSRCSFGNSDQDQNNRGDSRKNEYAYCTINSLAEPLPSVSSNSSLNQPPALLRVDLYDKIQTNSNTSKAKTAASACSTKINAYDHVIRGQHVQMEKEGNFVSPVTSTLGNNSLRLKRGRRFNRNDTWRKDVSGMYNSTADSSFSKRYVVLESDGFYFANEETEA